MNILHLANSPISGAPYRLMKVQQDFGWNARLINHTLALDAHSRMIFPGDIVLQSWRKNSAKKNLPDFNKEEIFELFAKADILHFHNFISHQYVLKLFPKLKEYLKKKLIVIQYHSPRMSLHGIEKEICEPFINRKFVVAQYQTRQFPECVPVPNAIPIDDLLYLPSLRNNSTPIIAYSPSNTNLSGWNNKGHNIVCKTFRSLHGRIIPLVVTNTPHEECAQQKGIADIAIDEVVTGSYHLNTLEALSMGQVAICGLDPLCEEQINLYTGYDAHPIVKASPKNLQQVILDLIANKDELNNRKLSSRQFMEKYWSSEYVCNWFSACYNGSIKNLKQ